jgi:hypothetical protein
MIIPVNLSFTYNHANRSEQGGKGIMQPNEKKLTWETPVIEDYDVVETTGSSNGPNDDGINEWEYS